MTQPVHQLPLEHQPAIGGHLDPAEVDAGDDDTARIEAGIDRREPLEAAHEQYRAEEEQQRERDLRDDEPASQADGLAACRAAPDGFARYRARP